MVDEEVEYLICCARMHRWLKWYLDLVATGLVVVTQHLLGRPQTRKNAGKMLGKSWKSLKPGLRWDEYCH